MRMVDKRCQHCGRVFSVPDAAGPNTSLAPYHDYPPPCRSVCPGSKKPMRARDDTATLGKDEPERNTLQ